MFEDVLTSRGKKTRKGFTVLLALAVHGVLIACLVLMPLVYTEALPRHALLAFLVVPLPAPSASPVPDTGPVERVESVRKDAAIDWEAMIAPSEIPTEIPVVVDAPRPPEVGFPGGAGVGDVAGIGDIFSGVPGGLTHSSGPRPPLPPPPPPPPVPPAPAPDPVRLSGSRVEGFLITEPKLEYPDLARRARVEGTVVLEAVISREGRIHPETVRVVTGHTLLAGAAAAAVLEWPYQPYTLGGQTVEVITTISVNYSLR